MALESYVTLGRSDLRVSPLCLGTMTFGDDWGWGSSTSEARAILSRYLDLGGNFIDTANLYTNGHSEKILGDFFAESPAARARAVIATKFFCNMYARDPNGGGASRKAIMAQCEGSLRRLRSDYVDLYWLHSWDRFTPIDETLRALDDLVAAGKTRYIGVCNAPAWKVAQAQTLAGCLGKAPLIALQIEYSLLQRTVESELIPMAQDLGLGVTPWSPLRNGLLSGKYTRENTDTVKSDRGALVQQPSDRDYLIIDTLRRIADETGTSAAAVALAWIQGRPGVTSTIIGARTLAQLDANVRSLDLHLDAAHRRDLDGCSAPARIFPADYLMHVPSLAHAGATVNGEHSMTYPTVPPTDAARY